MAAPLVVSTVLQVAMLLAAKEGLMEDLDLTSFGKAIAQLDAGLQECEAHPGNALLRDGVIHRFEVAYELSWKMLNRHLEATLPSPEEVDGMMFHSLIRTGSEQGLLLSGGTGGWIIVKLAALRVMSMMKKRRVKFLESCPILWRKHDSGKAKQYPDLDLAIIGTTPLTLTELASLEYDFDQSNLLYKVDVVDWVHHQRFFPRNHKKNRESLLLD